MSTDGSVKTHRSTIEVQLLDPDLGIDQPSAAVADRHDLDLEALHAAARSASAPPDRIVSLASRSDCRPDKSRRFWRPTEGSTPPSLGGRASCLALVALPLDEPEQ
jgi:hypothetical protein